ncbi:VanZ family protein [Nocardioides sp. DS6]|uniref:VanZ family protein n=1 Tax=Nocardioides eburneus TaxID=3231482 RepID=A0ABV3SVY9_9ACTN
MNGLDVIARIVLRDPAVQATLAGAGVVLVVAGWLVGRRRGWPGWRCATSALAGAGTALVLATTLARSGGPLELGRGCLLSPGLSLASPEARLNVLLFVPLALFATLASGRWWAVVLACVALSAGIEAVQSVAGTGVCQSSDVLRNGLGALAGAMLGETSRTVVAGAVRLRRSAPRG